jgi:tetratricopeptide (TPR) repeat protein
MLSRNCSYSPGRGLKLSSFLIILVCVTSALAQEGGSVDTTGTGGQHSIQGRLIFPSGKRAEVRLKVRLESSGAGDLTVLSDSNGFFSFQSLRAGNYVVIIDGGENYQNVREAVFIEPANISTRRSVPTVPVSRPFTVQVYLQPKAQAIGLKAGVLDASLASVPKPAIDLYNKALESIAKGENGKAIEQLKQSLALYPSFVSALNELGVQYIIQKQIDKAVEALRSAVNLAPNNFQPRLNYGIALLNQMKLEEAESQLREAIKLTETAATAHMYLGITLVNLKRFDEAAKELERSISLASGKLAQSHYYLGGIYWRAKEYKRAADELEKYLLLEPKAANADKVRATIKDLRSRT